MAPRPTPADVLANWYAPWREADASWWAAAGADVAEGEPAQRLRYRLWCARLGLAPHPAPADMAASWWLALRLPGPQFLRRAAGLGLALACLADRRRGLALARRAAQALHGGADTLRWALQAVAWAGAPPLAPLPAACLEDPLAAGVHGLLRAAALRAPGVAGRLRLRWPRECIAAAGWDDMAAAARDADEATAALAERVWRAGAVADAAAARQGRR